MMIEHWTLNIKQVVLWILDLVSLVRGQITLQITNIVNTRQTVDLIQSTNSFKYRIFYNMKFTFQMLQIVEFSIIINWFSVSFVHWFCVYVRKLKIIINRTNRFIKHRFLRLMIVRKHQQHSKPHWTLNIFQLNSKTVNRERIGVIGNGMPHNYYLKNVLIELLLLLHYAFGILCLYLSVAVQNTVWKVIIIIFDYLIGISKDRIKCRQNQSERLIQLYFGMHITPKT